MFNINEKVAKFHKIKEQMASIKHCNVSQFADNKY